MAEPIIHFDYDFSPYGQKTKLLLSASGADYSRCDQPMLLPRPDLEELGITFRRIPLLAIGKDVYADSNRIINLILEKVGQTVPHGSTDHAFATWADAVFQEALGLVPTSALTPEFVKDREAIFPFLKRPDFATLRPSALAQFHARLRQVENDFLAGGGPFIHGAKISVADVHVIWPIRWVFNNLGLKDEPEFGREDYPRLWKLIDSLPPVDPPTLSSAEMIKTIRGSGYSAEVPTAILAKDSLAIPAGTNVTIESWDAAPGSYPQAGKLIGTGPDDVVIEVKDGLRLHFPRIGYIVRAA